MADEQEENIIPNKNTFYIVSAFFLIFFGFGTAQQFLTILFKSQGRASLALVSLLILYFTFMVIGVITPNIISRLGLKNSLVIGAMTYAIFNISLLFNNNWLLYITSFFIGIGASLLWTSSAQIITDSSPKNKIAKHLSYQLIFLSLGNIFGLLLFSRLIKLFTIDKLYAFMYLPIILSLFFLLKVKVFKEQIRQLVFKPFYLFDKKMLLFFPIVFASNYLQGQVFTGMNFLVSALFGVSSIGIIITIVYIFRIGGNLASGIVADNLRKDFVLYALTVFGLAGILLFTATKDFFAVMVGAMLIGIFISSTYAVCLAFFKEKLPPEEYIYSISVFNIYANIGILAAIFSNLYFSFNKVFIPVIIFLTLSFISIYIFNNVASAIKRL